MKQETPYNSYLECNIMHSTCSHCMHFFPGSNANKVKPPRNDRNVASTSAMNVDQEITSNNGEESQDSACPICNKVWSLGLLN